MSTFKKYFKEKGKPDNCKPISLSSIHGKIQKQRAQLFVSAWKVMRTCITSNMDLSRAIMSEQSNFLP